MQGILKFMVRGGLGIFVLGLLLMACQKDQTNPVSSISTPSSSIAGHPAPLGKQTTRPLSDFFKGQTFLWFWQNGDNPVYLYYVDYANFYTTYLGLPTTYTGSITETPLSDGTAEVVVDIQSDNAFTSVRQFTPAGFVMGASVADVHNKIAPALLGSFHLKWDFINTAPGAPIPVLSSTGTVKNTIQASVWGPLSALAGLGPDGTPGHGWMNQIGLLTKVNGEPAIDGYTAEFVKVQAVGNGH